MLDNPTLSPYQREQIGRTFPMTRAASLDLPPVRILKAIANAGPEGLTTGELSKAIGWRGSRGRLWAEIRTARTIAGGTSALFMVREKWHLAQRHGKAQ